MAELMSVDDPYNPKALPWHLASGEEVHRRVRHLFLVIGTSLNTL